MSERMRWNSLRLHQGKVSLDVRKNSHTEWLNNDNSVKTLAVSRFPSICVLQISQISIPWTHPILLSRSSTLSSPAALLPRPSLWLGPLRSGKPLRWGRIPSAWLPSLTNRQQSQTGAGAEVGWSCFPSSELGNCPGMGLAIKDLFTSGKSESQDGFSWNGPKDHLIPAPCCGQGQLPPDQVVPNPIHPIHCCASIPRHWWGQNPPTLSGNELDENYYQQTSRKKPWKITFQAVAVVVLTEFWCLHSIFHWSFAGDKWSHRKQGFCVWSQRMICKDCWEK